MKRNVLIAIAGALLVIIIGWYFLIYGPKGDDLTAAQAQTSTEQAKTQDLEATLSRLNAQAENSSQQEAQLRKFDQAIPKTPDEGEFIIQLREIADSSGIEFMSVAPSPPSASGTGSTIALNISISGSFFQVKNYMTKLENLERLVIIDGINISAGAGSSTTAGSSSDTTTLTVALTGRMFTQAAPPAAAGAAVTPTTPGTDPAASTTTAPGGATSSSTAPVGSSTTGGT